MSAASHQRIKRREFLERTAGSMAVAAVVASASGAEEHTARKPNVIYAFSDEHRWQSMSFTQMPGLKTPHMRALAAQGITFSNCVSNYPVCSPHRAILMTGRWPYQQGVIDNKIPLSPDEMTLGKAFQAAGYHTAYIGKWHLGGLRAEPFGFDTSLIWTGTNTHWDRSKYHPREGEPAQPKGYNATLMTDQALAYLDERSSDGARPFFMMLSWNPPHSNFLDPPPEKQAMYPEGSLAWRDNVPSETRQKPAGKKIWGKNSWPHFRGYHAHVSAIDDELGRVMAKLDALGLTDNTILVYSSDHGTMMGSHKLGGKRQPFEESILVPFCVRWPGVIPAGQTSDALFGTIDVMPTLCELAGIDAPGTCVGQDFSPILRGGTGPNPESQLLMHISKKNASGGENHPAPIFRGLRTRRYTYAVYGDRPWCLFDNENDPYQQKNLIDDPAAAELRNELRRKLETRLREAEDPFELPA
ncbi:MAG: sulfatase-like hydrolase/transferase [Nitrospiraceae bacterium]|nr:sulfatase-like hydrolase/transferase [Nitrospiraceae bacterium]